MPVAFRGEPVLHRGEHTEGSTLREDGVALAVYALRNYSDAAQVRTLRWSAPFGSEWTTDGAGGLYGLATTTMRYARGLSTVRKGENERG